MTYQLAKSPKSVAQHLGIGWDDIDEPTLRKCASAYGITVRDMDSLIFSASSLVNRCRYIKNNSRLCGDSWGPTPEGFPRCQHHRDKAHYDFRGELLDPANIDLQEVVLTQLMAACNDPRWFGHPFFSNLRNELAEAVKDHLSAHGKDELETIKDIWS